MNKILSRTGVREETIDKDAKAVVIMILFIFAFFDYSANIGILFPA
jgi:hypothetical protein